MLSNGHAEHWNTEAVIAAPKKAAVRGIRRKVEKKHEPDIRPDPGEHPDRSERVHPADDHKGDPVRPVAKRVRRRAQARRWTAEEEKLLRDRLEEGCSVQQVCEELRRSRQSVYQRASFIGAHVRNVNRSWSDLDIKVLIILAQSGMRRGEIAEHFGMTKGQVNDKLSLLRKNGITIPRGRRK